MKRFIFLDIDGVLNNGASLAAGDPRNHTCFDLNCVTRLRRLIAATDATIVVSSSWRHGWINCLTSLAAVGLPNPIDRTGDGSDRGTEIADWINQNLQPGDRFVILDDDIFDLHPNQLPFTVNTSMETGLTDNDADKAINILIGD